MEGDSGGGFEYAAHFADCSICGNLEGSRNRFLGGPSVPKCSAVGEDGDDDGLESPPPVRERQATDGVP